ncbi:MAG: 50S ribosomal protein L35 [Candidatus Saccharibacteria bacterium]
MPKIKTHKGTAKRVKITKTGKITRQRAFGKHLLSKKSKSRKRAIKSTATITGAMAKNVKRALGV